VYMQISLKEQFIGKSPIQRWISGLDSKDGSSSFAFGSTNTIVVCRNTFHRAYGELQRFRHTTNLKERVAIATKGLRIALEADEKLMESFKMLASKPATIEAIQRVGDRMFKLTEEKKKELSARRANQIKAYLDAISQSITEQGDNLWAVFNGVTRYTNHIAAAGMNELEKQEYLMTGGGERLSSIGYDELMQFVKENTTEKQVLSTV
jgi:hypothetical protein